VSHNNFGQREQMRPVLIFCGHCLICHLLLFHSSYICSYYTEPPRKCIRIENEHLIRFRNVAASGINILDTSNENQNFLNLDQVHFLGDSNEPSILMIHKCYRHLLALIVNDNNLIRKLIITGNPEIGKTYFGYLLLYDLIRRHQTVIYDSHCTEHVIVFDHTDQRRVFCLYNRVRDDTYQIRIYLDNAKNWYIVDSKSPNKAFAKMILICSPKKSIYKEFEKLSSTTTHYMTVWSYAEISMCKTRLYGDLSDNFVKSLFDKWGGIPQFVLEKATDPNQ
jgi:hypothetical protein